jgi:hypothetical protein
MKEKSRQQDPSLPAIMKAMTWYKGNPWVFHVTGSPLKRRSSESNRFALNSYARKVSSRISAGRRCENGRSVRIDTIGGVLNYL